MTASSQAGPIARRLAVREALVTRERTEVIEDLAAPGRFVPEWRRRAEEQARRLGFVAAVDLTGTLS